MSTQTKPSTENGKGAALEGASEAAPPVGTLYERIAWVTGQLDDVKASGKNQFAAKALSIGDVEGALRPLLAQAGIVTRWSYLELEQLEKALWKARLRVTVSDGEDDFLDEWIDIGGNPMAATSFARKGYLKALFHITEADDETGRTETRNEPRHAPSNQRQGNPAPTDPSAGAGVPAVSGGLGTAGQAIALFKRLADDPTTKKAAWDILVSHYGWHTQSQGDPGSGPPHKFIPALHPQSQAALLRELQELDGREIDESRDPDREPVAAARGTDPESQVEIPW